MMQRLLPYGLQNYLPDNIAKPIIELSSLFKQLCSATLMEDDMLKASVKVVEILCELERIYPPAFFDIMIHLPIHLALEALEGGPIHPRWMFLFERFMKKLKGYVRNKAKPEGSIAEGYVAEEALTLSKTRLAKVRNSIDLVANPKTKGEDREASAAYSFTPENRGKKVLKSHDCNIMMQRLLPYGLQNYLPDNIANHINRAIFLVLSNSASATLMVGCHVESLGQALEALEGGPIYPRWMFLFERFMKKLKGYVRNKAKLEGSIAEGYVAEEAMTLSFIFIFRDVTTKFNRLERNVDPPPPTCQFQAFRSVCNTIGLRSFPPFDAKEFNKARMDIVLQQSMRSTQLTGQFQRNSPAASSLFAERHANNLQDPEVSTTSELFALANGPSRTPMSVNACVVDGVRYVVQSRDEHRTTQNSGICAPGPNGEMSYGQLQEIIEFKYLSFKVGCSELSG
ncbi:hypothetical protein Tco_1078828 [Tanacetum coccineum]|uniref:DUF4218 domain-containing protein n=1 Tax=Tanacetum coccineum TaxID=301880 RepID=A0ABQ5HQD5_9ASTR